MKKSSIYLVVAFVILATTLTSVGQSNAQTLREAAPPQSPVLRTVPGDVPDILDWSKQACKTYLKVKFCAKAIWEDLKLKVCLSVAGVEKCWTVVDVGCYEYSAGIASAKVCVKNLKVSKKKVSFKLALDGCVDVWITKKCKTLLQQNFTLP